MMRKDQSLRTNVESRIAQEFIKPHLINVAREESETASVARHSYYGTDGVRRNCSAVPIGTAGALRCQVR